ncbi:MAG: secretin N-terminal domain-containing protein [Phycisphaeraceae bacterium]
MDPATEEAPARDVVDAREVDTELPEGQAVEVGSYGQIDLHVKELPLTQVLQLLSIQSERNIIAARDVSGQVSADLYGADFYEALDAILHSNGYGYREKGNFIYVYTAQQIEEMEEAERETVSRIVRLNYIPASDISAFVSPMLSSAGSLSVSGESADGIQPGLGDAGSNSYAHADTLVIRDYVENVDEILQVIEELDQRPKQVLIEATVLQATLTEANAFGVDFAIFADLDVTDFTSPLGAVNDLISGSTSGGGAANTNMANLNEPSSIKIGYAGNDAAVFIRALDDVTDTTVLATPKILALNRQRAELLVGERLGYISTTQTETSSTQTVEFLDVGTQLNVRPFISEDNYVRLELKPRVSEGDTSRVVEGQVIPETRDSELTTNVIVQSGQTVVLGGLFKEDVGVGRRQVPGLGNIPFLGTAFRGQDDSVRRSEVIFLIKPTVLRDEALYAAGEHATDVIETARVGVRKNLLPFGRSKLTSSHLSQAQEHLENGDTEKALWSVNVALHLNPTSIEALRMKEQLTGERVAVPDRGILGTAVDEMIDSQIELEPEPGSTAPIEIGGDDATEADAESDDAAGEAATRVEPDSDNSRVMDQIRDNYDPEADNMEPAEVIEDE